ncbi:GNAT family N-acetyltransferase [Actinosynnema sp. NPDC051121]|nr:GNAT family N-acetyltransferase [Saccharothrix sp.]
MIELRRVDDGAVERLLGLAVADADPADVMPPGWALDRPDEFREFYRGFADDAYEIVRDDRTVGMVRLTAKGETGMWIARCARGRGIGLAALRRVLEEAPRRGITEIVADTTTGNAAALTVLRKAGATLEIDGTRVYARIAVPAEPSPDLADPRDLLTAYLDFHRDAVLRRIDGLAEDDLRTGPLPSGRTPLAVVEHLAHLELRWLRWCFRGEDVDLPDTGPDRVLDDGDTVERVRAFYLEQCARSREIAAESALTDRAARWDQPDVPRATLGWILFHLLQEYARHVGQLDVLRELGDGVTGT